MARQHVVATLISAAFLVAAGAALGWWSNERAAMPASEQKTERSVLYWYDPMVPQQHFDKPGKSPFMDMQLVPRYAGEPEAAVGVVVPASTQQTLGLRLAKVQQVEVSSAFEATAVLAYNERDVAVVQSRAGGFVKSVRALAVGDLVAKGEVIAELVFPEWTAAEQEWLVLRDSGDAQLARAALDRLEALGIESVEIYRLQVEATARSSFGVRAPRAGVVQSVDIREGMSVVSGQTLVRVNGTAMIWIEIAVPEALASSVQVGDPVQARAIASPATPLNGQVAVVLPALDPVSRTLRVRVELNNADGRLRPGQSVQAMLETAGRGYALAVPTEAVIRTGRRSLVMLAENGGFRPVEVALRNEVGDLTIIARGLEAGQQVVASGQFLLDSEASLRGIVPAMTEQQP